jgi:hypothetical protein
MSEEFKMHDGAREFLFEHRPIPEHGDLFSLDDFIGAVEEGFCLDCDGHGYYCFEDWYSYANPEAIPSEIINGNINRNFTHVLWFSS